MIFEVRLALNGELTYKDIVRAVTESIDHYGLTNNGTLALAQPGAQHKVKDASGGVIGSWKVTAAPADSGGRQHLLLFGLAPEVATYAMAIDKAVSVSVERDEPGWAIRVTMDFTEDHPTRAAALAAAKHCYGDGWNWLWQASRDVGYDIVRAWINEQQDRFPGLVIVAR